MSLIKEATAIRENAYAPYSNFKVGAALKTASGKIFTGVNVENAAYPEGTCAEAGAIAAMIAAGEAEIAEITVVAGSDAPCPPCGGCRQKINEFARKDVVVTMATLNGDVETITLADMLPGAFGPDFLE